MNLFLFYSFPFMDLWFLDLDSVPPFMLFILSRVVANVFLCCTAVVVASSVLPCIVLIAQHIPYKYIFNSYLVSLLISCGISMQNSLTADGQKEDFSDLPPNQQRKKLQAKIAELQHKVDQETNTRDGLMKMKIVYEANSSLGNPMTVEGQLNESEHELEKLKNDLKKYQGFLDKANQQQVVNNSPQSNRNVPNGHRTSR